MDSMKWKDKWVARSESSNADYTIARSENGEFGCSCPQWKFRRGECKHIRQVKIELAAQLGAKYGINVSQSVIPIEQYRAAQTVVVGVRDEPLAQIGSNRRLISLDDD